ncbi:translation initiation factor [Thermoleptolyngbya sp. C42_A2020_037]|uniref:translation initiation factor n=1 Tax=Thermoleptolyngbya sp. C42_A2020_037 TaxID=2747799 RepID=UPI0019D90428|nr:translation initiation factor [Thermoleptolyngbya sp. C42_A2020_037]MBF2086045.1 translation initiation factor [Thermoleptolyngbya sp. C42_A2020_037]
MNSSNRKKDTKSTGQAPKDKIAWQEFGAGTPENPTFERPVQELPPNQQQIRVQASRKGRGGKTVTVISGFQTKPETLAALLKTLKTQCGAGGTVKDLEIEIQGDHREKIMQVLVKQGYKAKVSGG